MILEGYLNAKEFAQLIKVDRVTLYRWEKSGKLIPTMGKESTDGRVKKYYTQHHIDIIKSWNSKESVMLMYMGY